MIAGPTPVPYRQFLLEIAKAAGSRPPLIIGTPAAPLIAAAGLTRYIPGLPTIEAAEIRRLLEDKDFDVGPMRTVLGVDPIPLHEGLALTFRRDQGAEQIVTGQEP